MTHLVTDSPGPDGGGITPDAPVSEAPARRSRVATALREIVETLLLALFIYLTVRAVVQNFKVEGSSMHPTLSIISTSWSTRRRT
jgi:signal peptidase I